MKGVFDALTPDQMLATLEAHTTYAFTGLTAPLPSYINRVYELETQQGDRLIAKFYRPGRWSRGALEDEHHFLLDCVEAEIPVVAPLMLNQGSTIGKLEEIHFALFPKKSGREMSLQHDEGWRRLGALVGRMHSVGQEREASHRLRLNPEHTTLPERDQLVQGGWMSAEMADHFSRITDQIIERAIDLFEGVELQRIHGDLHRANILERPSEGLLLIDFEDMVMGPAVQDLWLLLPEHIHQARYEMQLILEGYEQFCAFDEYEIGLVEVLRAMRMIYFLSWCSTQVEDYTFRHHFPDWGEAHFWQREIADLERQLTLIKHTECSGGNR